MAEHKVGCVLKLQRYQTLTSLLSSHNISFKYMHRVPKLTYLHAFTGLFHGQDCSSSGDWREIFLKDKLTLFSKLRSIDQRLYAHMYRMIKKTLKADKLTSKLCVYNVFIIVAQDGLVDINISYFSCGLFVWTQNQKYWYYEDTSNAVCAWYKCKAYYTWMGQFLWTTANEKGAVKIIQLVQIYRLIEMRFFNSYSASHDNWCTETLWNRITTAQCEGMGEVGSARYDPALLPPCPSIRVLSYSNCQEIHSRQQAGLAV